jgi:hypothetical protein
MHERGLQIDREKHRQPHHLDPGLMCNRCDQRQHDERDLEEVEEESETEYSDVHEHQEAEIARRYVLEKGFDPNVSVQTPKDESEKRGVEQKEDNALTENAGNDDCFLIPR